MSMKIYNGFKFKTINSLDGVLNYANLIRPKFNEMADRHWAKGIITSAVETYDYRMINKEKADDSAWSIAYSDWMDMERESMKTKGKSLTNIGMEIAFTPVKLNKKKSIIGMVFIDDSEMRKQFFDMDEIEDFGYWDNTDEPDDIDIREWNYRGKIWNNVFKHSYTVGETMPCIRIVQDGTRMVGPLAKKDFDSLCPSFDDRAKIQAYNAAYKVRNDITKISELLRYENSKEFDDFVEINKKEYSEILQKEITFKDITN